METDLCNLCRQTRRWHEDHNPKHPFQELGQDPQLPKESSARKDTISAEKTIDGAGNSLPQWQTSPGTITPYPQDMTVHWPSDPVLRMILVEKGIITTDDLDAAEAKLRAISGGGGVMAQPQTYVVNNNSGA